MSCNGVLTTVEHTGCVSLTVSYLSTENTRAILPMARILLRMTSLRAEAVAPGEVRGQTQSYKLWLMHTDRVLWRCHPDWTVSNSKVSILRRAERVFWTISSIQKCVRRTQCKHLLLLKPRGQIIWNGSNPDTHHNNWGTLSIQCTHAASA